MELETSNNFTDVGVTDLKLNENEMGSKLDDDWSITDTKVVVVGQSSGETAAEDITESTDDIIEHDVIACLDDVSGTRCILRSQKRKLSADKNNEFDSKKSRARSLIEKNTEQMLDDMSAMDNSNGNEYKEDNMLNTRQTNEVEVEGKCMDVFENMDYSLYQVAEHCGNKEVLVGTEQIKNSVCGLKDGWDKHYVFSDVVRSEVNNNKSNETVIAKTDVLDKSIYKTKGGVINANQVENVSKTSGNILMHILCKDKKENSYKTESNTSNADKIEIHSKAPNKSKLNKGVKNSEIQATGIDKAGMNTTDLEKPKMNHHIANFESDPKNVDEKFQTDLIETKCDSNVFICPVCGKILPNQSRMTYHMTNHSDERIHKCSECEKTFKTKDVLTRHVRTHKPTRHFCCETCGAGFNQTGALQRHRLVHTDVKPHKCKTCGAEYRTAFSLKAHKLRTNHYSDDDKKTLSGFKCDKCGKEFLSRYEYNRHYRTHLDTKPFTCTVCLKSFNDMSNLRQHSKIHDNDRPHECGSCDRRFIQPRSLRKHLVESGHCDKNGNRINSPVKILVKAEKEKTDFPCHSCNTSFQDRKMLQDHHASSEHLSKMQSNRTGIHSEIKTPVHVSRKKPVSILSNFDLLSAAASHVEKLALEKDSTEVTKTGPERMDKTIPEKLNKVEETEVNNMCQSPVYRDNIGKNSNDEQNMQGLGNNMMNSDTVYKTVENSNEENTEVQQDYDFQKGTELHKILTADTVNSNVEDTGVQQDIVSQTGSELRRILTADSVGQTGISRGIKTEAKTYPMTMQPKSKIILFKVNPGSVPLTNSKTTGSNIYYSKSVSTGCNLTLQSSLDTSMTSFTLIPVNSTIQPTESVQRATSESAESFTGLKTKQGSKYVAKTVSSSSMNNQQTVSNSSMNSQQTVSNSSMNSQPSELQKQLVNYQSSELRKHLLSVQPQRSQFHGTILRNIKPESMRQESKLVTESFDLKTESHIAHSEEHTNTESDSSKLPDFCFDSDVILNNDTDSAKSENTDVNNDVNSYLDGNAFVESHSKANSDSETTLTNTNSDNGNIFMNFLQEDSFPQTLYFSKPGSTERQFDPFFYNNPTRSQILYPSTSTETWPGAGPSLNTTLLQDSKFSNTDQGNSESFNSASEQMFSLP